MTALAPRERPRLDITLDLTPAQERFRTELRDWLVEHVPREPEPTDEDGRFAFRRAWQARMHRDGWAGIAWPAEYGGRGAGPIEQFVYYEELAWARAPEIADTPALLIVGPTLMVHGTEEQKRRYLPPILGAEEVWCQGFSEPGAGSDLTALRTRAELVDGRWRVTGEKIWTTLGPVADFNVMLVRTDEPEDGRRHTGLSMLIVPHDQPGVDVRPIRQLADEVNEFCQIFFDGALATEDGLVGGRGEGWGVALTILDAERSDHGFTDHGRLFAMLDDIRTMVGAAVARGALRGDALAETRRRVTDLFTRCQLLAEFNLGRAYALARGERMGSWGSFLKLYWSEIWQETAELGLDLAGRGELTDRDWAREYLLSRAATIYSGTSEIQRGVIGDRLLGLPR